MIKKYCCILAAANFMLIFACIGKYKDGFQDTNDNLSEEVIYKNVCEMQAIRGDEYSIEVNTMTDVQDIMLPMSEYETLARIVQAEAGNEDIYGKLLVANVVLNRTKSTMFPDTVTEVVMQHEDGVYQFSPVGNGRYYEVVIDEDTYEAVNRALEGEDNSDGALFFVARAYASEDNLYWFDHSLTRLFAYGGHEFYK